MMNEWIISSSILIAAVLLGRFLLRGRISLRLQYGLWLVVLLRLLLPVQLFTSDFGAGSIAQDVDISAPVRQVYTAARNDDYQLEYDAAYQQVVAEYEARNQTVEPDAADKIAYDRVRQSRELDLKALLYHLWFAGMVVMTAVIVSCNVHLSLQLRRRRWECPTADSLLPVYVTEAVPTPCIFGFFHPVIYLTPEAAGDDQTRTHVLTHELTHYRHLDHIWSVLRSVCLVLHWYNPLVWMAAKVSRADAELACDEGALARLGEDHRGDYGRTLIGLTCAAPIGDLFVTATTMTGSAGSIRERIRLLMKRPRNTVLTVTAVALMVTLIVGCSFAGAPEATQPTETTDPGVDNDMSYQEQDLPIADDLTHTDLSYALPMEQAMANHADNNPRKLTEEELILVRSDLASTVYSSAEGKSVVTPVAAFFTSYYDDVTELDLEKFLRYFPVSGEATEEEFQLLHQKYGAEFYFAEYTTLADMPVPVHRYEITDIDNAFLKYTNLPFQALRDRDTVYHLEETGCYYNFTSDFAPGTFDCVGGFRYDGGAILYSESAALFLTETMGNYSISAHLPLIGTIEPLDVDGVLVFPGTEWFMTEREVLMGLGLTHRDILDSQETVEDDMTALCITVNYSDAFDVPMVLDFIFRSYQADQEPLLMEVYGRFEHEADFEAVRSLYTKALGETDVKINPGIEERWDSETSPNTPASHVQWLNTETPEIIWSTELPADQIEEVFALFADGADPWYLAALTAPYADWQSFDAAAFFSAGQSAVTLTDAEKALITEVYGPEAVSKTVFRMTEARMDEVLHQYVGTMVWNVDLSAFVYCLETASYLLVREEVPELRRPEILSCAQLDENQVRMIYCFPGGDQRYCATLLKGENWKVYSNHLLINQPRDARALTEEEIEQVREAFQPSIYDEEQNMGYGNPLAAFLLDTYEDISQMRQSKFLSYYPTVEDADEEEFQLLKQKYPEDFENTETIRDMLVPIHRVRADELDAFMAEYTLIRWDDLPQGGFLHYLEETDCYYTYYSDFGLFGFPCTGGWVYDGGAMLCNDFNTPQTTLILTERDGQYYIQAHLPAIVTEK